MPLIPVPRDSSPPHNLRIPVLLEKPRDDDTLPQIEYHDVAFMGEIFPDLDEIVLGRMSSALGTGVDPPSPGNDSIDHPTLGELHGEFRALRTMCFPSAATHRITISLPWPGSTMGTRWADPSDPNAIRVFVTNQLGETDIHLPDHFYLRHFQDIHQPWAIANSPTCRRLIGGGLGGLSTAD